MIKEDGLDYCDICELVPFDYWASIGYDKYRVCSKRCEDKAKLSWENSHTWDVSCKNCEELQAKLDFIKQFVETEDGTFCFPDGELLTGCKIKEKQCRQ